MEGEHRPTLADLEGDNRWALLARKHWLKATKSKKVKLEVIKSELWDVLEAENFEFRSLLLLENLHLLEKYELLKHCRRPCSADLTQLLMAWLHR